MSDTATLAFEIGTEEIPAFDLKRATEQLAELVPAALDAVRIPHGEVAIYTSPRRLIAIVADVRLNARMVQRHSAVGGRLRLRNHPDRTRLGGVGWNGPSQQQSNHQ